MALKIKRTHTKSRSLNLSRKLQNHNNKNKQSNNSSSSSAKLREKRWRAKTKKYKKNCLIMCIEHILIISMLRLQSEKQMAYKRNQIQRQWQTEKKTNQNGITCIMNDWTFPNERKKFIERFEQTMKRNDSLGRLRTITII